MPNTFGVRKAPTNKRGEGPRRTLLKSTLTQAASKAYAASHVDGQGEVPDNGFSQLTLDPHPETVITSDGTILNADGEHSPEQLGMKTCKVGNIVKVPHVTPSLSNKTNADESIPCTVINGYVCAKIRYAIIVTVSATNMTVLPVFSSNKQGLARKPKEYIKTALSVWNPKYADDDTRSMLTELNLVADGSHPWYPGSHVNLAVTLTVNYSSKMVQTTVDTEQGKVSLGKIREADRKLLLRQFRAFQESAYKLDPDGYFLAQVKDDKAKKRAEAEGSSSTVAQSTAESASKSISYAAMANKSQAGVPSRLR